jgi:predicted O-methyltransferase YrrM
MNSQLKKYISQGTWLSKMTDQAAWGLIDLIKNLGHNIKGIEIGVQLGMNSYMLLDACPNITKIIGIDPYEPYADWDHNVTRTDQEIIWEVFKENLELMQNRFELYKEYSWDAADQFEDESFDFVFIDGDHSIKAVLKDLDCYAPKIKKGGIIAGHDVGLHSVNIAVTGWCKKHGVPSKEIIVTENQTWYWTKK